ncbi:hypothetical protein PMI31_05970, partial [Pseudomonas sp. GM55]
MYVLCLRERLRSKNRHKTLVGASLLAMAGCWATCLLRVYISVAAVTAT